MEAAKIGVEAGGTNMWEAGSGSSMTVSVKSLRVVVNKGAKILLDDVSFSVDPGDVVALMGPSGAGKTTLLNQLVGRGIRGDVSGSIVYNGQSIEQARSSIGYVTQDDIMYETLTPRENMRYAAAFIAGDRSASERESLVDQLLDKMRLTKAADTVVGTPGLVKGISGGERKRTNVAMSLLGTPSLLLLDEPTSGLDSKMADGLMADVSALAATGCTVIATIHQPSDAVFARFSKVLLLESGRLSYYGPVPGLPTLLKTLGFEVPERKPLPELLLDILDTQQPAGMQDKIRTLTERSLKPHPDTGAVRSFGKSRRISIFRQLAVLFRRGMHTVRRNRLLTVARLGQTIISTVMISWIFAQLDHNLDGVATRMFCSFVLLFSQFLFAIIGVVNTFPAERAVFLRETQDRWYHPAAFYISKVVIDTIMQCIFPIVVTVVGYWIVGLNDSSFERVVIFAGVLCLTTNIGAGMGFIVSALVPTVTVALAMTPLLVMPQLLLSGIFIQADELPQPWRTISFATVARYGLQAITTNEFTCEDSAECFGPNSQWRAVAGEGCDSSPCSFCCTEKEVISSQGRCPVLTCHDALRVLNLDADSIWPSGDTELETIRYNVLVMCGLLVVFRSLGLVALMVSYRRAARG